MININFDLSLNAYKLTMPFNQGLIDVIKGAIPAGSREYDPITKAWIFKEEYWAPLEAIFKKINARFTMRTKAEAMASNPTSGAKRSVSPVTKLTSLEVALLRFAQALPQESLKKAYRDAATSLHPDKGGDQSKMIELNAAWDEVQKAKS